MGDPNHTTGAEFLDALRDTIGPAIGREFDRVCDAPSQMAGDGWRGTVTCHMCPLQIEGEVDGRRFYFRDRGGASFGIAATADEAIRVAMGARGAVGWGGYCDDAEVLSEAWPVIAERIETWRSEGRPMRTAEANL